MQAIDIDVQGEFARLREAFTAFESIRTEGLEACRLRVESVSGWSVEQHLYHIALATDLAFRHVQSLVRGKGRLIRADGAIEARAAEILENDATPRGVAQAPRMVTPPDVVEPEYLDMELRGNRDALEGLREIATEIAEAPGWIPHQDLGLLSAAHWLRFSALHARHHWAIVRDVRDAAKT